VNRPLIALVLLLGGSGPAPAQVPDDRAEGSRLTVDRNSGTCTLSWWGRSGKTYFVRCSEDLLHWSYLPLAVPGADCEQRIVYPTQASRLFMELEILSDPFNTDFDGDGMPDGWELVNGLNPRLNDAAWDPDHDGLSNLEESALQCHPGRAADLGSAAALSVGLVLHTDLN
jgi:hypothetical protein